MMLNKLLTAPLIVLALSTFAVSAQTIVSKSPVEFQNPFSVAQRDDAEADVSAASKPNITVSINVTESAKIKTPFVTASEKVGQSDASDGETAAASFKTNENSFKSKTVGNADHRNSTKRQPNNDYWKFEFFGGFQTARSDIGINFDDDGFMFGNDNVFGDRYETTNGLNVQATANFSRYVGAKFDFSATGRSDNFVGIFETTVVNQPVATEIDFDQDYKIYNFLGGVQIKDNSKESSRFKPFFHAMAGVARQSLNFEGFNENINEFDVFADDFSETSFALAIGGGLDIAVNRRVDIRIIQADYNPVFNSGFDLDDTDGSGGVQNNFRFSFGIVIH